MLVFCQSTNNNFIFSYIVFFVFTRHRPSSSKAKLFDRAQSNLSEAFNVLYEYFFFCWPAIADFLCEFLLVHHLVIRCDMFDVCYCSAITSITKHLFFLLFAWHWPVCGSKWVELPLKLRIKCIKMTLIDYIELLNCDRKQNVLIFPFTIDIR